MFYLGNFYKILGKNPASGLIFLLLTSVLTLWAVDFNYVSKKINYSSAPQKRGDHFYGLIDARENIARIARKIKGLPGVYDARQISEQEIDERLRVIFSEVGSEFALETKYGGINIIFLQGLEERSQDLIREYLVRLVGRDKVTLGPIKKMRVVEKTNELSNQRIGQIIVGAVLLVIMIFWQISYYLFGKHVAESSYLISQYQRKNRVGFKIMLSGVLSIILICSGVSYIFNDLYLYGVAGVVAYFTVNLLFMYKREVWAS